MIKRVGERVIFKTKFFTIKDVDLQSEKGKVTFQVLEKGDSALIVPVIDNEVIFIKEYFAAIDAYCLSLPKGRVEEGTDPVETANKELQEEIGYKAGIITHLATLTMSPGYLTQKTHVFLAQQLTESRLEGDEIEPVKVVRLPLGKVDELIETGKLTETRVITSLFLAKKKLQ